MNPISIVFAGDFCAIHPERLKMGTRLAGVLQSADLRCINFEGPLQRGKVESANGMYLAQSDDSPKWIKENGFNLVALANNHACDFGADGLIASRDAFQNLYTVGCGDGWDEAYKVKYIGIKDKVIGLLNVTSADFSSLKDEWTDAKLFGCPWVNHPSIPQILIEARKQCDYLIVLPHAGVEFMDVPLPEWRTRYRNFIDLGADAVIASHPHVPQGWELYKNKPIYYSLGNFVFEKETQSTIPHWYSGLIVCLELQDDKIRPSHYCTLYENDTIELDITDKSINHITQISDLLSDDRAYMKKVNEQVQLLSKKYEGWMITSYGAFQLQPLSFKRIVRALRFLMHDHVKLKVFLHQLREESTQWVIQRAYKNKSKINR